jgi:hypothetical protein
MKTLYCPQFSLAHYLDRDKTILDTWGANVPLVPYMNLEGYYQLTDNILRFLKNIDFAIYDFDWYFLCCDDTYVWPKRLELALSYLPVDRPMCFGSICDFMSTPGNKYQECIGRDSHTLVKFPSGSGFGLNRSAIEAIQKYLNLYHDHARSWYADVSVGFWLRATGATLIHSNLFDIEGKQKNDAGYEKNLTVHRVSYSEMHQIHDQWRER